MEDNVAFTKKLRVVSSICLFFIICIFLACTQQVDINELGENITNPPISDTSSPVGGNSGQTGSTGAPASPVSSAWEDYNYYKNLEIKEENLTSALIAQDNKAHALYLMKILRDEIVPQATNALLKRFPQTFSHLKDQVIGMGLALNTSEQSTAKATFGMGYSFGNETPYKTMNIRYTLTVNYSNFEWDGDKLKNFWRQELEATVAHEMMHAFMCETLTRGFTGLDHDLSPITSNKFPLWFIEGTAETICGAADMIRLENGFGIDKTTTEDAIKEILSSDKYHLTSGKINATYKTGYLAVLYLSYLTNGSTSLEAPDLAKGLDTLLSKIHKGASLSDAIVEISNENKKFSSLEDFEARFATEGAHFIKSLMTTMTDTDRGAILTGKYSDRDLLDDIPFDTHLFWLNIVTDNYYNKFDDKFTTFDILKGGSATQSGEAGPRSYEKLTQTTD